MKQTEDGAVLQQFYEINTPSEWDFFLGPVNYHYHCGVEGPSPNIFENAIYANVFPFIADRSSVLDCGCGWGAPAEMLTQQKKCKVTCVTNSTYQADFIKKNRKGLRVLTEDLNCFKPARRYDVALLLESFCHVKEQDYLLKNLFAVADNILIVDHVVRHVPEFFREGWLMQMFNTEGLANKVTNSGYKIQHIHNSGEDFIIPTAKYWKSRLDQLQPKYGQLKTLWEVDIPLMFETAKSSSGSELCVIYASKNL